MSAGATVKSGSSVAQTGTNKAVGSIRSVHFAGRINNGKTEEQESPKVHEKKKRDDDDDGGFKMIQRSFSLQGKRMTPLPLSQQIEHERVQEKSKVLISFLNSSDHSLLRYLRT